MQKQVFVMNNLASLSEYIPFLIILGGIILSIRKGLNKPNEEEMAKTTLPGQRSGKVVFVPKPDFEPELEPVKKNKRKLSQLRQEIMSKSPADSQSITPANMENLELMEETVFDIENTDDLKKAVIYSEILNRKDY